MVRHGCRGVAMELSSHALDQERTAGLELDVAVMTNLGRDHLDYHFDLAHYLEAKARIRDLLRPLRDGRPAGAIVVNRQDERCARSTSRAAGRSASRRTRGSRRTTPSCA